MINCPYIDEIAATKVVEEHTYKVNELVTCEFYTVHKLDIFGKALFHLDKPFQLVSVIEGNGSIEEYILNGDMQLIVSSL